MNMKINELKIEKSVFMMPKDTQGYFHRYGWKEDNQSQDKKLERVVSSIHFVEKLVNILQLQRKTNLNFADAAHYWEEWRQNLPWEDTVSPTDCAHSLINLEDLNDSFTADFLVNLPQAQLFERDKALNELGTELFDIFLEKDGTSVDMEDYGHLYLKYVVYAIRDLSLCWDTASLQYVAPLYRTSIFEKESFSELSQFSFPNFCYLEEVVTIFSKEKNQVIQGIHGLDGEFHTNSNDFLQ